ncbi:MAG: DNA repair protein RadC [Dysgonamonadaceae bacterium]|jgi:DNA repair protein RadC|nr:DNA repair protein RadC [Dysgonamonadaceae bacterium]
MNEPPKRSLENLPPNEPAKRSLKDLPPDDQPREKLLLRGTNALSDAELLAVIINSGTKDESAVQLSQRIFHAAGNNINQLGKFSVKYLMNSFKGIGTAKAISIVAALELGKRRAMEEIPDKRKINSSRDIYECFHPLMCDLLHEEFWVLFLNRANRIIDKLKISQGGVAETIVDAKLIYKEALIRLSSGLVLCHNHPSGNIRPSVQDDQVTSKVKSGAKLLDLNLLDHVIVGDHGYFSYQDEGKL